MTKDVNAIGKLLVSVINTAIVFALSIPFIFIKTGIEYKYVFILAFFLYQVAIIFTKGRRSVGMRMLHIYWAKEYGVKNHLVFALLYTLSFSTIIIWLFFPFDLLILNLLFVQLPFVHFTGYTLHGFLSGKMKGVKKA